MLKLIFPNTEPTGGDFRGRSPKFEIGDVPCIRPPIAFRELLLSHERQSTNCFKKASEIEVFGKEKGAAVMLFSDK